MPLPLTGVRLLDFSRLLPGGYSTQLLADLGAEVIKIETPKVGDYARVAPAVFGGDSIFHATNRGKKSLALNFRTPEGRAVLMRLVESADALFEMFRPGMMDRWGIGYEALKPANPRLVYCALSGYGQTGPYRDRSGHDLNYVAISGLLDFNGVQGNPPLPMAVQIADMAGGMMAALAIASALYARDLTKEGAYIDLGLMDMAVSWAGPMVGALYFARGEDPSRGGGPLSGELPCYNVYRAKDGGYLTLAALEPLLWSTFCKVAGRPDLFGRQYDHSAAAEVAAVFGSKDLAVWIEAFEGSEVCVEPVAAFSDMLDHPQVRARGLVIEDAAGNPVGVKASPWHAETIRTEPPRLGEDSRQVLLDFGFEEVEIDRLAEERTIREG